MNRRFIVLCLAGAAVLGIVLWLWPKPEPRASGHLHQEVYVWQRAWNEPVLAAITGQATNFAQLIALCAEVTWQRGQPSVIRVPLKHDALRQAGRPCGLALRIGPFPGPFAADDDRVNWLIRLAADLLAEAATNQIAVAELQIDFDCAESKLDGYRLWVEAIRRQVAPTPVVITALPAWLKQRAFRGLIAAADAYVLQVHSLERPRRVDVPFTLCDPAAARRAVERAARFGRPFRVALPTYGYVMAFDAAGRFIGLSAEGPAMNWPPGVQLREVRADPEALAGLVKAWMTDRPEPLRGVIWYRLPVRGESLNWPWPTLSMVMAGNIPQASLRAEARRPKPGLVEVDLVNGGQADYVGGVEVRLRWSHAKRVACDGLAGFEPVDAGSHGVHFKSSGPAIRLGPGQTTVTGWARLDQETEVQVELLTPSK